MPESNAPTPRTSPGPTSEDEHYEVFGALWQGPLPPPSALEAIEKLHPGATAIFLEEFQIEAKHRREEESAYSVSERAQNLVEFRFRERDTHVGQALGLLFAMMGFGVILCSIQSHESGVAIAVAGIMVAGVIAFILGRRKIDTEATETDERL